MLKKPYKSVEYKELSGSFILLLDGRPALTPLESPLALPNAALAQAVASEWQAQGDTVRKETMPLTQMACMAINLVGAKRERVVAELLPYGETDLVCYRAGDIPDLAARQARLLDPVVAWAEETYGIGLMITDGLVPVSQPAGNKTRFALALSGWDDWKLAALAAAVKPLGSLILSLAFIERHIDAAAVFALSHLEEAYETERWGYDGQKEARLAALMTEIAAVERFLTLLMSSEN